MNNPPKKISRFGLSLDAWARKICKKMNSPQVIIFALDPKSFYAEMSSYGIGAPANDNLKERMFDAMEAVYKMWVDEVIDDLKKQCPINSKNNVR